MNLDPTRQIAIVEHPGQSPALVLQGEVGIYCATELFDAILRLLAAEGDIHVQCDSLAQLDTAALQLLILLCREASHQHREFRMTGVNDRIGEALRLAGAADLLASPTSAAS